jgi:Tol biopolymer transport system component
MTPERWRQITEIFHAVLARDRTRRDTLLAEACASDPALRRDVEDLLAADEEASQFGETPSSMPTFLRPGTRLGSYRVDHLIGVGGMGEVYRAHDSRLERDVAMKVLPSHLTTDPERLAMFEREARVLASLNHPHIGALYGVEESGPVRALVMELIEGDDLAERMAGGGIALAETLQIAGQIAAALEAAHEQGIVHRDLKPANIKVRDDGTVKVLDFGLARALEPSRPGGAGGDATPRSPEPTSDAGKIVGTAAYMPPEQVQGKAPDQRGDIWAFGVVLCEMLSGQPCYGGGSTAETLRAIVEREPSLSNLPATTPANIRTLVGRCLTRDPRKRLQAIGEARIVIENALAQSDATAELQQPVKGLVVPFTAEVRRWAPIVMAALGVGIAWWAPWRTEAPAALIRMTADLGVDASIAGGQGDAVALSSDGSKIAFVAKTSGRGPAQLYVRQLNELNATALRGTDDASSPFFSPDGQWVAFFAAGALKKISVSGGAAVTLCRAPNGRGGAWGEDGRILFAPDSQPGAYFQQVSSAGGDPTPLLKTVQPEHWQRWPQLLPGGKAVLYTGDGSPGDANDANLVIQALPSGPRTVVQRGAYHGRYLASGHLVYIQNGTLFAVPFDLDRTEVRRQPAAVVHAISSNSGTGAAQFALSANGTLVYLPGYNAGGEVAISWLDRAGKTTPMMPAPTNWFNLAFAPDGNRLALQISDQGQNDLWIYEWARQALTRLTSGDAHDSEPVWTPDSRRIAFSSGQEVVALNLYWRRADGTGSAQRLTESRHLQLPRSWHPNGRILAFEEQTSPTNWDLWLLPLTGDDGSGWTPGAPTPWLSGPAVERKPMFSPDGKWLAYDSDESGRQEIYVRPFPGRGRGLRLSTDGGTYATWSRTTRELFYSLNGQIMVVAYTVEGDTFHPEPPRPVPGGRFAVRGETRMFDLHPDGLRFALAPAAETSAVVKQDTIVFTFNFLEELQRLAPPTKE